MDTTRDFADCALSVSEVYALNPNVLNMDSTGLGAVDGAYVAAQKAQGLVALTGMNERLRALTETSRLSGLLAMYANVAEAETALR